MPVLFSYRDNEMYSHHSIDENPEPENFSMHAHEWMEIIYFISVEGSYLVEGNHYALQPHDILITRSAETHKLVVSQTRPYERMVIHFSPSMLTAVDPNQKLLRPFLDRPLGQQNLYPSTDPLSGKLRAAFADFTFDHLPDVRLNLFARLLLFLTTLNGIYEQAGHRTVPGSFPNRLVTYVNEHLFEPLSVQSIADHFYLSRSQISRVFTQATGSSLWEYVTIKRLLAARARLQRGETAGNACIACGFSDYSAFFRAYRAHFGHSPKEDAASGN